MRIPFCDLAAAHAARGPALEAALLRVARSGRFVMGPEVAAFEEEWAAFCGARYAVGVASGTDALTLALRAARVGRGDEVIVPAYTAPATWMAVALTGASPVDPDPMRALIGPRTVALIAVHLFGRLAPMRALRELADRHGLLLVEDAAHAHGADEGDVRAGELGDATAFSFYPTKLLGAVGEAGAVVTEDEQLAVSVRRLRSYGQGWPPGDAEAVGGNSRLDELQAAALRAQLDGLSGALERLRSLGGRYRAALAGLPALDLPRPAGTGLEPA
jgi:dTDP-3-amino-3,4,6-trideoxy-alpha-D-glucose transaminase